MRQPPRVTQPIRPTHPHACLPAPAGRRLSLSDAGYVLDSNGHATINLGLQNHDGVDLTRISFSAAGWTPLAPAHDAIIAGLLGDHLVSWYTPAGRLEFTPLFGSYSLGTTERFSFTVQGFIAAQPIQLTLRKGENVLETHTIDLSHPACDRTPPPVSPLPTPTPPPVAPAEVYVLRAEMFTAELSEAEKQERWSKGLPAPLVTASLEGEVEEVGETLVAPLLAWKPGLMAQIRPSELQTVDPWQERDMETFENAFPNASGGCTWSRTQRASGGQLYIWGRASDRSVSPTYALWPAGAIASSAPTGTQPLPANSNYPANMITSVICKMTGMTETKNLLAEFQMWYELADAGDSMSVQFFSGSADNTTQTYRGGLEWRGVGAGAVLHDWMQYRIYYPEMTGSDNTIWVRWRFSSDQNGHGRGPWLDDLSVWSYKTPESSAGCESADPTFAPNLSKGLNLPPYAEDIKNGESLKITAMVNRLVAADVDWVRLEFRFYPGSLTNRGADALTAYAVDGYDHIDYRHYDRLIDSLCAANPRIAILALVDNQTLLRQDWRVKGGEGIVVPNHYLEDFVDVVSQLVAYFDDRIGVWEIWNEPDHSERRLRADQYAVLLANTYQAIKTTDSSDQILFGGLGGADLNAHDYSATVLTSLLSINPRPFDIFALHPYHSTMYRTADDRVENDPGYYMRGEINYRPATIIQKFRDDLDNELFIPVAQHGKAIWATELGWNSSKGKMKCPNFQELVVTQEEQTCYLQRGFHSLFNLSPTVAKVFWYQYHDTGQEISQEECGQVEGIGALTTLPSPSWVESEAAQAFLLTSSEPITTVPWEFGLYTGDIWRDDVPENDKDKPVLAAFRSWPVTDACMNDFPVLPTLADLTEKVYAPIIYRPQQPASGE